MMSHYLDDKPSRPLTEFALATLQDRYLLPNESPMDAFKRVAQTYADDVLHANRLWNYMRLHWFIPATPVLANGGANRGLPISCFLNEVDDSMAGIAETWDESVYLGASGGGIGTYWGNVRSIGEPVGKVGETSGVIPFIVAQSYITNAVNQGSQRRGSAAGYLPVWHPEIEEFIDIRRDNKGGDRTRQAASLSYHNAVVIDDAFMEAVRTDSEYALVSPKTGETIRLINARNLWFHILDIRMEKGEPYLLFIDNVAKGQPPVPKALGLEVKMSNLCSEITLPTGLDHKGNWRTAVCCLSSVNLELFDEWKNDELFIEDMFRYLDNILSDFIARAPDNISRARYSAMRERSVGLGTMGFHSYLQRNGIPFGSALAKQANLNIFKLIKDRALLADRKLAKERGMCPDAEDAGILSRFSHMIAIAPNASSSIICNSTSPGIEPYPGGTFKHKTLSGTFIVRNPHLEKLLESKGKNTEEVWKNIHVNDGSVQHLDFLSPEEKEVFKTAFEIDQSWLIELAADRQQFICQSQSLNLYVRPDIPRPVLNKLHWDAWKKGIKSLYYLRSKSLRRAEVLEVESFEVAENLKIDMPANFDDTDQGCIACQG